MTGSADEGSVGPRYAQSTIGFLSWRPNGAVGVVVGCASRGSSRLSPSVVVVQTARRIRYGGWVKKTVKQLFAEAEKHIQIITPHDAINLRDDPGVLLVAIRDIREHQHDGRVPGAELLAGCWNSRSIRKVPTQRSLRLGQALRVLLRGRTAFGAGYAGGTADGP